MEQISSSTTILMQNPKQSLPLFNFLWCKIHLKQSLSLFHRLWCKLKQSLSLFNFMLCKSFKTLKLSLALEQNFLISVSLILSCKRLGLLGMPPFQKSAVFFNIVQKAFDPPLLFEHLSYFAGGIF